MSFIKRLKLENEPKSTRSVGKLFQRFTTRSAKKLDPTELLHKCLKILYRWPLVKLGRNSNSHLGLPEQAHISSEETMLQNYTLTEDEHM